MWKCHKCGKPVYFAERKQSLGYDWHPECLRCEECGKRLNPGLHAEHKGVPYCNVPCYGALFGPQLFGHGTRVESHKNFGQKNNIATNRANGTTLPRDHMESKLKVYNQYYDNKSMEIRSREVNNRLILEGPLRVYWGVEGVIHLKEDDDQRTVVTVRKRNSCRYGNSSEIDPVSDDKENDQNEETTYESALPSSTTTTATTSGIDDISSTDISLSESMTFDSCSLSEDPLLDVTSNPTATNVDDTTETTTITTATDFKTASTNSSVTLPSKIDSISLEWDELDELLQVERKFDETSKIYETMPSKLPSSSQSSSAEVSPTEETVDSTDGEFKSDAFVTATDNTISVTDPDDDNTLKAMDFEEFKKSVHLEYVNGANSFLEQNSGSLKNNQRIDPSRINDSLKLYGGENPLSKSFNEQALRTIDPTFITDTLNLKGGSGYNLQKSSSSSTTSSSTYQHHKELFEKGLNRSRSGPNCYLDESDKDADGTLKPNTIRRNGNSVGGKFVNIKMDCYHELENDESYSKVTDSNTLDAAGELTTDTPSFGNESSKPFVTEDGVVLRRRPKLGSAAIKRRSGNKRTRVKLKRRCSINGHFYNRETSFFTPPYGSQMSVWVTSLVSSQDVINLILEKYKVDSRPEKFSLFVIKDNGEQKRLKDDDYPLVSRVSLGPHEDVAKLFLMDSRETEEISNEVAQFINLSIPECHAILSRYDDEFEREVNKIKEKYSDLRHRITNRMESLKVRL
ncbi:hypothetical protein ACFFRR_006815 [Megaselia abdita]